ncbi:MGDG synthase family glycosyltransferase [Clostridium polynesiense]|uniref:MGDG synthase family glycosyltransferase n=1 Tax=Clostridium polynesiense TaxID=1325933 RepID=UPI00058D00FC|nr:glycosyltransferase [Clostridium polynesiense]
MKKVLILTTSTGQGHNQAADSLKDTFVKRGYEVIKYDFLDNNSKFLTRCIVGGYELLVSKTPKVYGGIYKITNFAKINSSLKLAFMHTENKVYYYITQCSPDIIIGTHPLSVNIISSLKKHKLIDIPFISIVTDFKAHSTYISPYVDAYITASEYTKKKMSEGIIPENRIFPYGIPIKQEFFSKADAFLSMERDEYFNILLMGGSMGLNNIFYVLERLMKNKHKLRITVVCGNNSELKSNLEEAFMNPPLDKKIHIFGFTTAVASLMELSDIIISKPGGLTASEALVKNLPMIIPFAIPGQETENAEFLSSIGCAVYEPDLNNINNILNSLIENPDKLLEMKNNIRRISKHYSINEIVSLSERLINSYERKTSS